MDTTETTSTPSLRFLWLELTARCNLACTHCYAESSPTATTANQLTTAEYDGLLSSAREAGCESVQFIGGEPTLHPGLPSLIARSRELGFTSVEVYTNATHLPEPLLTCFGDHDVQIATSLYADQPKMHDAITKRAGSHDATVRNIRRCIAAGRPVRIGIIAMPGNQDRLEQTVAFARALGTEYVGVDRQRGIGRGHDQLSDANPLAELCGACTNNSLAVAPDGQVFPCIMSRQWPLGSVRAQELRTFLGSSVWEEFRTQLRCEQVTACGPYEPCFPRSGCPPAPCPPNDCIPFAGPRCRPEECGPTIRSS